MLAFPPDLYPAVAPLPVPMANHLLLQEKRQYQRLPSQKHPEAQVMIRSVLERIRRARIIVYDYLRPFVLADEKRQQRGESRTFPDPDWLLETLAHYTPNQKKNDLSTLDYWQKKGLLRREKRRGLLDVTNSAALLVARLAEGVHQRNWLPACIAPEEPWWWCYGQDAPHAPLQAIPLPLPDHLRPSLVIWTPWQGAAWEREWRLHVNNGNLYRWAKPPELEDLHIWNNQLPAEIHAYKAHPLLGRPAVQRTLLEEARHMVLTDVADRMQKGITEDEEFIR